MIACARESRSVAEKGRIAKAFAPASGSTRSVFFGRGLLWLMILVVIGLIFYIAIANSTSDSARLVFSQIKQMGEMQNVMKSPYYHGIDKNNLPYSVTADTAIQQDAETVLLENIKADIETKEEKWIALHSGAGMLKTNTKILTLTKKVDIFYDGGYEFRSESAVIDIDKGEAHGEVPVTVQGPLGTLEANSFAVSKRGDVIRFNGAVKVKIYR